MTVSAELNFLGKAAIRRAIHQELTDINLRDSIEKYMETNTFEETLDFIISKMQDMHMNVEELSNYLSLKGE